MSVRFLTPLSLTLPNATHVLMHPNRFFVDVKVVYTSTFTFHVSYIQTTTRIYYILMLSSYLLATVYMQHIVVHFLTWFSPPKPYHPVILVKSPLPCRPKLQSFLHPFFSLTHLLPIGHIPILHSAPSIHEK
jgi:hypothetical protein